MYLFQMWNANALSQSTPPFIGSPSFFRTAGVPSAPNRMTVMSNVPPPRSYTRTVWFFVFSPKPYESAAAMGSSIMPTTFSPAFSPASRVRCRADCEKYAGNVMTTSVLPPLTMFWTFSFKPVSFLRTMDETVVGLSFAPRKTG